MDIHLVTEQIISVENISRVLRSRGISRHGLWYGRSSESPITHPIHLKRDTIIYYIYRQYKVGYAQNITQLSTEQVYKAL